MSYTKEELKRYIDNFYNLNENELLRVRAIIIEIINRDKFSPKDNWLDLEESELLSLYAVKYICEFFHYPHCRVVFEDLGNSKDGYYRDGIIRINTKYLDNRLFGRVLENSYPDYGGRSNDILHVIFNSMHECHHYFQNCDFKGDTLTRNSMCWFTFSEMDSEEYHKKYNFIEVENLANKSGWLYTYFFLSNHRLIHDKKRTDLSSISYRNYYSAMAYLTMANQKSDDNNFREPMESYEIKLLLKIIKNAQIDYPDDWEELIPSYIVCFFTKEGNLRPTQQLVNIYNNSIRFMPNSVDSKTMEMFSTYEDIIEYALLTRRGEDIKNKEVILEKILQKSLSKILMMSEIPDKNNDFSKDDFIFMFSERLERLLNLLNLYFSSGEVLDSNNIIYFLFMQMLEKYNNDEFKEKYSETLYSKKTNNLLDTLNSIFNDNLKVHSENRRNIA